LFHGTAAHCNTLQHSVPWNKNNMEQEQHEYRMEYGVAGIGVAGAT